MTRVRPSVAAVCERVGDWWEITVPGIDSVTQVRRLDDVPAAVLDLVAVMTGDEPEAVVVTVRWFREDAPAGHSVSRRTSLFWRVLRGLLGAS